MSSGARLVTRSVTPGAPASSSASSGAAVEHVLEVVEHEQRPPAAQVGDQYLGRIAAPAVSAKPSASAIAAATRSASTIGASSTSTTPSGNSSPRPAVASIARRVLPVPPAPVRVRRRTSARLSSARISRSSRLRPTKEVDRARRLGAGPVSGARRHDVQLRILSEDRPLEAPQRRPRLDPERLHQRLPRRPVGRQRLRLPARAVEREHQLAAQALRQRVLGDQELELADELAGAAESEVGVDAILERGEAKLLEPTDLTLRPWLVGELGEWRAAPEREGLPQPLGSDRRLGASRLGHETLEAVQIEADPARRGARSPPAR